jgi:hypothetical protein
MRIGKEIVKLKTKETFLSPNIPMTTISMSTKEIIDK